jgi:hypothetical protein
VQRAQKQITEIVSFCSAGEEFSSGAAQPIFSVALVETLLQK